MDTITNLCFLCTKDYYNCISVDKKIVTQVEYLLPEITIITLGIPLRICTVCKGALYGFSKFKQSCVESSRRLEASIKGAQGPPLHTDSPPVVGDNETSGSKPEQMEEIFIKEEYMEQTPLDTEMHTNTAFLNPISTVPDNQLHTDTNSDNTKDIFIKEEHMEGTPQDSEFYCNILKKECVRNSMKDNIGSQPEHIIEKNGATLNTSEEVWEGSSDDSEKETAEETVGYYSKNIQTDAKEMKDKDSLSSFVGNQKIKNKNFFYKHNNLVSHIRIRSGIKDFQCKTCDKSFKRKDYLTRHIKIHSEIKDFQCDVCNKSFTRKDHLTSHMRIHSRIHDFQCELCYKSFKYEENLTIHMKNNCGIKKFQCEICVKSFAQKYSLIYHMKVHSGIKEFQCKFCDKSFTAKGTLNCHLKIHSLGMRIISGI